MAFSFTNFVESKYLNVLFLVGVDILGVGDSFPDCTFRFNTKLAIQNNIKSLLCDDFK